jgi:endonuclease G
LVVALGGLAAAVLSRGEWLLERLGGLGGPAGPASPGGLGAPPSDHLALGVPAWTGRGQRDPDDDHLMIKPQYALSYNRTRNGANWVSWHLSAAWFGDVPRHRGRFLVDEALPAGWYRAQHDDYTGSGYDRGHMVRSEERTRSVEDNKATFLMTNILPQQHDLNAGPWLRLEERCQHLAQKEGRDVHIVAGGLFGGRPDAIGKSIAVPEAFFKIIVVLDRGQAARGVGPAARVIAVIMPNESGMLDEGWGRYRTSVDAIEQRAGYDFLTAVPEPVQRAIEARVDDGPADPR